MERYATDWMVSFAFCNYFPFWPILVGFFSVCSTVRVCQPERSEGQQQGLRQSKKEKQKQTKIVQKGKTFISCIAFCLFVGHVFLLVHNEISLFALFLMCLVALAWKIFVFKNFRITFKWGQIQTWGRQMSFFWDIKIQFLERRTLLILTQLASTRRILG